MIAPMRVHRWMSVACASVVGALGTAGCSGTSILPGNGGGNPTALERGVDVIKAWSEALHAGHVRAAAGYFQIPSVFADGPDGALVLRSRADAETANRELPCGAVFVSAEQRGRYIDALFKLTERPGPGGGHAACASPTGLTARVDFIIASGKITHWLRAPSLPGDNGTTTPTTPTAPGHTTTVPTVPTIPTTPGTGTQTAPGPTV